METLISQFTFFSDQALQDKKFDPFTSEELMKLFEIESYKAWVAVELDQEKDVEEAEFRHFEEELDHSLIETSERKMGSLIENAASFASKRYTEAAVNSAIASTKVHPS